jgi:hypothetical protein
MENDHETRRDEAKHRKDIMVAQIRSAGYGAMQDIDENKRSDFQDVLDKLHSTQEYQDTMNLKQTQESNKMNIADKKLAIENRKLDVIRENSQNQLKIARENQTKAEIDAKRNKSSNDKKTK